MSSPFDWRARPSELAQAFTTEPPKAMSPQLAYYHRARAAGLHPRQLRAAGKPVIDRRFKPK